MKTDGRRRRVALLAALVTFLTALGAIADGSPAVSAQPASSTVGPAAPPGAASAALAATGVASAALAAAGVAPGDAPAPAPAASVVNAPRPWLVQPPAPRALAPEPAAGFPWRASMLVLAVAALGGGAVYVRRSKLAVGNVTAGNRLRVMSSVRVGPKGYLVLAGVGERAILLGVTDDSVRRIAWMDSEVSPPPGLPVVAEPSAPLNVSRADASTPPFRDFLRGLRASAGGATKELQVSGPADEVAAEKEDVVQWSAGITASKPTRRGLPPVEPSPGGASSLEQQAAGIARRKARRPT